jgi:hypothetical protein
MTLVSENTASFPEPLCRDPMQTGARIVIGLEGYFGEIWSDKQLVSIRWWPDIPTQRQWEEFVRASGIQASSRTNWDKASLNFPS